MMYAGIDVHKSLFQVAVLDPETGDLAQSRFASTREELDHWATQWKERGRGNR